MKFNLKTYQISKTKQYLKKNNFLLFSVGANQDSQNWVTIEQGLHKLKLNYYKIYNNTTRKIIANSIYSNFISTVNSTFFFLKPQQNSKVFTKNTTISLFNSILFTVLAIKLNRKIYAIAQSKNINSFDYKKNISVMYQFLITNQKFSHTLNEKR